MNRQERCILLGNGESRLGLDLDYLKERTIVWGCNAIYRDWTPDRLVCVDIEMSDEVYRSGYCFENVTYFREWSKLPADAYDMLCRPDHISRQDIDNLSSFIHESPRPEGWDEFVMSGQDLDTLRGFREDHLRQFPNSRPEDIDRVLGDKRAGLWITWCPPTDKVIEARSLPGNTDYGFAAGPLQNLLSSQFDDPKEVYLVGHDMWSETGDFVNNVYKDTDCYQEAGGSEVPPGNWIDHHKLIFDKFPDIKYYKVNPKPSHDSDRISRVIEEWRNTPNLEYMTHDELYERLN